MTVRASTEWEVWTTTARVVLDRSDRRHLPAAVSAVQDLVADVDLACSRFREDSELVSRAEELERGTQVSPLLATFVRHGLEAARTTDGDVDPTVGSRMVALGYDVAFGAVTPDLPVAEALDDRPSWRRVQLAGRMLKVPRGVRLDLGAIAKALTADIAAARITSWLGIGALVSLGGDVATAGPEPRGGWRVLVQDLEEDPAERVRLTAGWSVATSSTQKRRWQQDGHGRHHILDPRWGVPAEPVWRSVTVVAESCVRANTLTTAAVVRGRRAPELLRRSGRAARLVAADGSVVRLGGWPDVEAAA